jgi:excisionase family DNA binding protein
MGEAVSERLVNADAIAELLDVPPTWVREHARAGTIPHYRLGRYVRFREAEVLAWLADCRAGGRVTKLRATVRRSQSAPRAAQTTEGLTPESEASDASTS